MPRLKCHLCDNFLTVRPSVLENENYIPKCHYCRISLPPENWRCRGIVKTDERYGRTRGDRCKCWVKEERDDYCHYHTSQEEE